MFGKEVETELLHVGDYIHIIDEEIGVDKEIRITAITRDLLRLHSYELTLSDTVVKSSIVKVINDIQDIQDVISFNSGFTDPGKARRRWMATQELLNLVFDPEGDYYSEKIKPLSIETQMLSVGAKSTQFTLQNVTIQPNYNGNANAINFSTGRLVHYGIDPENTRPWVMTAATFSGLSTTLPYYIYAVCPRQGGNGSWLLSTTPHKCEEAASVYYFLVGVLNSVSTDTHGGNAARLISLTYGSSTINGRFIRCGRIESSGGGATYFDLDTGVISGRILFRSTDGTVKDVSTLEDKTQEIEDYINGTLQGLLEGIQGQLDGVIEQYFETVDPSPNQDAPLADPNEPASTWTTNEDKEKHAGDLYYNTESGKVWRYVKGLIIPRPGAVPGYRYFWRELQDTELAKALQLAQDAMRAADDKARIFYVTPYAPYDPGDLWVMGSTGDIMVCKAGRAADAVPNYAAGDWEKASKYTDDSGLHDFILNQYTSDMADLLNQVDGKIECFYTSANPANNWDEADYDRHVGDQWYDTSSKNLYRFCKASWFLTTGCSWERPSITNGVGVIESTTNHATYYWLKIENADAIAAAAAAAAAQTTANGKRTVFVKQPTAPYYVGDLWLKDIDSTGKATSGLWRCIKDNTTKGSFNTNDWVEATYYDCTQTAIDGGIVTAGTVQLANEHTGSIVAGITGGFGKTWKETASTPETEKVRIWAGASEGNRRATPFRVMQDGSLVASKATIEGLIKAYSGTIGSGQTPLQITENGLTYGDVSSWDLKTGRKMIISPESIRIQTLDTTLGTDLNHPFGRVSFGNYANSSSSYKFGTLAHVYKYDVITGYAQAMQPAMLIESYTRMGGGVALKTHGAIVAQGAIVEIGDLITTDSSIMLIINLTPLNGSVFIVKNNTADKLAQLPAVATLRYILGITSYQAFTITLKVISVMNNKRFLLQAPNDNTPLYNGSNKVNSTFAINANTTHEITLICQGSTAYWKIKNVT